MAEEKEKPLTREDVLRLIEENGGTAEGLDLSGKEFEKRIDLSKLHLSGVILEGAILIGVRLERADLTFAHLDGANLETANLEEAHLAWASLDGANLAGASLRGAWLDRTSFIGAYLIGVEFSPDTKWGNIDWGNYILGEETDGFFGLAEDTYRRLKQWHTNAGIYDVAGEFLFREMEAKRKNLSWLQPPGRRWLGWWPLRGEKVRLNAYKWLYGYGERPWRVVAWAALVVFLVACAHFFTAGILTLSAFWDSLYYSAVSFTALGYGRWAPQPTGWVKGLGAFEAFIGVFMIALFLVTFTRKMIR